MSQNYTESSHGGCPVLRKGLKAWGLSLLSIFLIATPSQAQTNWTLSTHQIHQSATRQYKERIESLRDGHRLDRDGAWNKKIQTHFLRLRPHFQTAFPSSRDWNWQVHSFDDEEESSYAMAGGHLLINLTQAKRWELNETEFALLLAHEMAHVVLEHHRAEFDWVLANYAQHAWVASFETLEHAIDYDEVLINLLAPLGKEQELLADKTALELCVQAGYAPSKLLGFFRKMVKHAAYPNFESASHPAPAERYRRAQAWLSTMKDAEAPLETSAQPTARPNFESAMLAVL